MLDNLWVLKEEQEMRWGLRPILPLSLFLVIGILGLGIIFTMRRKQEKEEDEQKEILPNLDGPCSDDRWEGKTTLSFLRGLFGATEKSTAVGEFHYAGVVATNGRGNTRQRDNDSPDVRDSCILQ